MNNNSDIDPSIIKKVVKAVSPDSIVESTKGLASELLDVTNTEPFAVPQAAGFFDNKPKFDLRQLLCIFVKVLIWLVPISIAAFLTIWLFRLSSLVEPVTKNTTEINSLKEKDDGIDKDISEIEGKHDTFGALVVELNTEFKHLVKTDEELNKKTGKLEDALHSFEKPIEKLQDDVSELKKADIAIKKQLEELESDNNP